MEGSQLLDQIIWETVIAKLHIRLTGSKEIESNKRLFRTNDLMLVTNEYVCIGSRPLGYVRQVTTSSGRRVRTVDVKN